MGSGPALFLPVLGLVGVVACNQAVLRGTKEWTPGMKSRIRSTFAYFAASIVLWAACGWLVLRSELQMNMIMTFCALALALFAMYKASVLDFQRHWLSKSLYFGAFAALQGLSLGTLLRHMRDAGLFHLIIQAAAITTAVTVATAVGVASAPSLDSLWLTAPLAGGLGLMLGANLVNMMLGSRTLHSVVAYLGAALFCGYLFHDAQRVVRAAYAAEPVPESPVEGDGGGKVPFWRRPFAMPPAAPVPFDPVQHAIQLYLDAVNLFYQLVQILTDQDDESNSSRFQRTGEGGVGPLGGGNDYSGGGGGGGGGGAPGLRPGLGLRGGGSPGL